MSAPALALQTLAPDADRRQWLGGSDAGAIMGCGAKYDGEEQTPYTVWLKKTSAQREELDPKKAKFFARRKRWEPVIIEHLREEFDAEIVAVNQRYVDPDLDFLAAELDFEWIDPSDGSTQNGEIKTVTPYAFGEAKGWGESGTDEIPVYYAAQGMHGLGVTGRRICIVAAMVGLDDMIFYRLQRDDETITGMRETLTTFWYENVMKRIPPDPQSVRDMSAIMSKINGRPVELSDEIVAKIAQLKEIRGALKAHKADEETIAFEIADFIRKAWGVPQTAPDASIDNAILQFNGAPIATWKKQRGASLDQKRLRVDHPEIVSEYMKEHWFRPFRFSK